MDPFKDTMVVLMLVLLLIKVVVEEVLVELDMMVVLLRAHMVMVELDLGLL